MEGPSWALKPINITRFEIFGALGPYLPPSQNAQLLSASEHISELKYDCVLVL